MDPFTIITVVSAIVGAVFAGTGPILPSLWRGFKSLYGGVCRSLGFLRGLGRQRLNNDIYSIMRQNAELERELYLCHRRDGMQRPIPGYGARAVARGRQMEYIGY